MPDRPIQLLDYPSTRLPDSGRRHSPERLKSGKVAGSAPAARALDAHAFAPFARLAGADRGARCRRLAAGGRAAGAGLPARRDGLRPAACRRRRHAAGRVGPGRAVRSRPASRRRAATSVDRAADLPLLHPARSRAGRRRASGCRTTTSTEQIDARGLQAPLGHELPRQPLDRGAATTRSRTASIGKLVIYNMEERQRVKIVDYVGLEEGRDVEDRREAEGAERRRSGSTRSSIPALVRKVEGIVRDMMEEKGFQYAEVTPRDQGGRRAGRSWCT